jgi:short-subunit dehydrogenase
MPLLDSDVSVAKKMFDVNVFAVVTVTQAFAPLLIASQGTIINIGSVLGKMPLPWSGYYNASKAAVAILTDQMRIEFAPWKVRAILVNTGAIRTKFLENLPSAPRLPENSLYHPAKDVIEPALAGTEVEKNAMDVNSYAEVVVNNAIRSSPKKHLWSGGGALITWLASTFGWSTIWVGSFP